MVHRDPETGKFVSDSGTYEDIEAVSFSANLGIEAANLNGAAGFIGGQTHPFEGVELVDYDEVVDRNERLELLAASHSLFVMANSTETADGTVTAALEVSADPALTDATKFAARGSVDATDPSGQPVVGRSATDDSIDIIGKPLAATGHAPFSDGATGVGGAGSAGEDRYEADEFPGPMAEFHPRDELFANGQFTVWNIDDAGVHLTLTGQHVYGVVEH